MIQNGWKQNMALLVPITLYTGIAMISPQYQLSEHFVQQRMSTGIYRRQVEYTPLLI